MTYNIRYTDIKRQEMKLTKNKANFILLIVSVIWGSGFIVVKYTMDAGVPAGLLNGFRGLIFLILTLAFFFKTLKTMNKRDVINGIIAGATNAGAYIMQTIGLKYTSPSVSGFFTALYILFVPFIVWFLFKKRPKIQILPAVILAIIGTFFLTGASFTDFSFGKGEIYLLIGALLFAVSISYLGEGAKKTDSRILAFWMGLMQALAGLIMFAVSETEYIGGIDIGKAVLPILYLGVIGTFITTASQVFCQKVTEETTASIIMTLEAVFASLLSLAFGYDKFTVNLAVGGVLIFGGVIVAIADFTRFKKYLISKFSPKDVADKDNEDIEPE